MGKKAAVFLGILCLAFTGCGEVSPQPVKRAFLDSGDTASTEIGEPEEITIAVRDPHNFESVAEAFVEEYPQYRITLIYPGINEDAAQFRKDIMAAVESGQGPDILDDWYVEALDYAHAGYIQPWGEIFEPAVQEEFLPGILDTGRLEGLLYGIPYTQSRNVLITSRNRMGDVTDWNLEQMMQLVENSTADRLASRFSGASIINSCVLQNKTDNPFIDWEGGSCDFINEDFLEILRFAREYGDPEYVVQQEVRCRRLQKGEDFAEEGLRCLEDMSLFDAVLEGDTVYLGYPTFAGAKVIVSTSMLFCNGATANQDGAAEFLHYLLSEEQQNRMMEEMFADQHTDMTCNSIRRDTIEHCLQMERKQNQESTDIFYEINQIYYYRNGVTEKQEQQFREIQFPEPQGSCYQDLYTEALSDCLWDALSEYMAGTLTEEEAAKQMQSSGESFFARVKALELQR